MTAAEAMPYVIIFGLIGHALAIIATTGNRELARENRSLQAVARILRRRIRDLENDQQAGGTVTPFYGSDRHLRAIDTLAKLESERFDPDEADWNQDGAS